MLRGPAPRTVLLFFLPPNQGSLEDTHGPAHLFLPHGVGDTSRAVLT